MRRFLAGTIVLSAIFVAAPRAEAALPLFMPGCGVPVTSSFRLAGDLSCPGTDGIVVGKSGITVDLNRFVVHSNRTNATAGVLIDGFNGVTVRNGTLRAFSDGFKGASGKNNRVIDVVAVGNSNDGVEFDNLGGAKGHLIRGVTATGNDDEGIEVDGEGISIIGNEAVGNGSNGFDLGVDGSLVKGNVASANAVTGFQFFSDGTVIRGNRALGNTTLGIVVSGDGNKLVGNRSHGNESDGIRISSGAGNVIRKNRTHGNGFVAQVADGSGLGIDASADATVRGGGNRARGNDDPNQCAGIACNS